MASNSRDTTVLSDLSLSGGRLRASDINAPSATLTAATITTFSTATGASNSVANSGSVTAGQLWITVGASGLSVGIESGGTLYFINSTTSAT